jgi:hypothetical protein
MDADDLFMTFAGKFFVGIEIFAGPRAGRGGQYAGRDQPAQKFLPLNGYKIAQDLSPRWM